MEVKDPYNSKARYEKWIKTMIDEEGQIIGQMKGISKPSSDIILRYIHDMERGLNVAKTVGKGGRSYIRLITLRNRMKRISTLLFEHFRLQDITKVSEENLTLLISKMQRGKILSKKGKRYKSSRDYAVCFTAFWHWWMKINKKNGKEIQDITEDLDKTRDKAKWVYIAEDQFKLLCNHAKYEYKVLMTVLWDAGIRAPSELINVRVSDLELVNGSDFYLLNIKEEVSKTFGRTIKLLLCSQMLKDYIKSKGFSGNDQIFKITPRVANQYLGRLAEKVLGKGVSKAGESYAKLTMYDFRHNSCCYWLPRYKSESSLKYRFGWKKSDKIHYYSEFLGMKDTITEQDLLVDVTASEIERRLWKEKQQRELLEEKFDRMQKDYIQIIKKITMIQKSIK